MAATFCRPSRCERMSRAGPRKFRVPSGTSSTASVGCNRQPGASRGVAFRSISISVNLWDEAAGRYVTGYYVSVVDCVELRPQDGAFAFQCVDYLLLLGARSGVGGDVIQREGGVFGGLDRKST